MFLIGCFAKITKLEAYKLFFWRSLIIKFIGNIIPLYMSYPNLHYMYLKIVSMLKNFMAPITYQQRSYISITFEIFGYLSSHASMLSVIVDEIM